jgi:PAS domain S-box-containing protein
MGDDEQGRVGDISKSTIMSAPSSDPLGALQRWQLGGGCCSSSVRFSKAKSQRTPTSSALSFLSFSIFGVIWSIPVNIGRDARRNVHLDRRAIHCGVGRSRFFHEAEMPDSRALNTQFRILFEAAPNGVMAVDAAGCIIQLNVQMEKMFGYSREELIGRPVEVLVPVRFRQGHADLQNKFAAGPQMRQLGTNRDLLAARKDGSEFPVEIGLNSTGTSMGNVVVATIVDITERKRATKKETLLGKAGENVQLGALLSDLDLVQSLFGLALAEARVATLIGAGLSPQQAAEKLGISVGNVRTTLKKVFTKVGVSRQSELAVLLTKLTNR